MKSKKEYEAMSSKEKQGILAKIKSWLKNGVKKILLPLANSYLGRKLDANKFIIDIGGVSATNGDIVSISITEEQACIYDKAEIMRELKFCLYHELSHVLYTDNNEYVEGINILRRVFTDFAAKLNLFFIDKDLNPICADLMNSIEDGRIENLLCITYIGAKKHRDWSRLIEWNSCPVEESVPLYIDIRNSVLIMSTMGILPKNFTNKYPVGSKVYEDVLSFAEDIGRFVVSDTIKQGFPFIESLALKLAPYITDYLGLTEEEYKANKPKYSEEELKEIARRAAEQARNHRGNSSQNVSNSRQPKNGPIVSILQDKDTEDGSKGGAEKPDVVVDLRKKPPKADIPEEPKEDDPYYYRPDDLDNPENEDNSDEESSNQQGSNSSNKDTSSGQNSSKGSKIKEDDDKSSDDNCSSSTSNNDANDEGKEGAASSDNDSNDMLDNESDEKLSNGSSNEEVNEELDDNTSEGYSADEGLNEKLDAESCNSENGMSMNMDNISAEESSTSEEKGETSSNQGLDGIRNEGASLPDQQSMEELIKEALNDVCEASEREVLSEVKRANKEEASWNISEESAMPLSSENIKELSDMFGSYGEYVQTIDYRTIGNNLSCPEDIKTKGHRLAAKIDKIIKAKSSPARRDCRTGLVDTTNLGKFISGQTDFYKQDAVNRPVDIACLILKDDSGSMSGENEEKALEVLAELEECFKKLDKSIKLRMQAFSTSGGETMKVIKDFDDNIKSKSYTYSFHSCSRPNGGNNDAFSISLATDIIAKRKEKQKLMIIVSDGAPCCSTELVKKAVARARQMGIFVISILIGRQRDIEYNWNLFQSMYEQNLLAGSLDTMGDSMFKFIKKFVASL